MLPEDPGSGVGLCDIHCHGAAGHSFGDTADGSRAAAAHLAARGVTAIVASLVTAPPARLLTQVRTLAPLVADGTLLGIHLEGPFLSERCRGAHDPNLLLDPDPRLVERLVSAATELGAPRAIRQLTFAPERPDALALVPVLAELGIVPAVGHTAAGARDVEVAIAATVAASGRPALVTHLFNGMPPFHHRNGGPVAAALAAAARGDAIVELIADGVHVAAEVVRMVFDTLGPDRIALVSDSTAATGLGDGDYLLGGLRVRVAGGTARLSRQDEDPGPIAGSTSTLAECVRWAVASAGVAETDAIRAATRTPWAAIGPG